MTTASAPLHQVGGALLREIRAEHPRELHSPGYIWTPMVENYLKDSGDVAEGRKAADAMHPIGHIGEPDDIAYGVVYLASDAQVRDRLRTRHRWRLHRAIAGGAQGLSFGKSTVTGKEQASQKRASGTLSSLGS